MTAPGRKESAIAAPEAVPPEAALSGEVPPGEVPPETALSDTALSEAAPSETAPSETAPSETAPPETAPPETAPPETAPSAAGRLVLAVSVAVLVVALACAAWFGWSWHRARDAAAPPAVSRARDQVLADGEQAVQNFNTLDYRKVSQGLQLWLQSSAGPLHSEILRGRSSFEKEVRAAKTITAARVLDGAVTVLNPRAGTASIIVALQITVTPAQGSPVTKQSRLQAQLTRTPAGWRLTEIGQVPA